MASPATSPSIALPTGWRDMLLSALKTAVIAFVVLQIKELYDAGKFDTPATAVDAVLISAAILIVDAIIKRVKS